MACVDSAYLDPLRHDYHEDAAFKGKCGICGCPPDWHVKEDASGRESGNIVTISPQPR